MSEHWTMPLELLGTTVTVEGNLPMTIVLMRHGERLRVTLQRQGLDVDEYPQCSLNLGSNEVEQDRTCRQHARELYACEGRIEIDNNAIVSRTGEPGAYVQGWLWVDDLSDAGRS